MALCEQCNALDIEAIFRAEFPESVADMSVPEKGILICRLNRAASGWQKTPCPLCRFFRNMRVCSSTARSRDMDDAQLDLMAFSLTRHLGYRRRRISGMSKSVMLAALPAPSTGFSQELSGQWREDIQARYILQASPKPPSDQPCGRLLSPHTVDYEKMRQWLSFCEQHHRQTCTVKNDRNVSDILEFKVINCYSCTTGPLPEGERYAALSYVCGSESTTDGAAVGLRNQQMAKVVQDAIIVATKLNIAYLWVDVHCISSDEQLKQQQLLDMDIIYKMASVTIVAANGSSSRDGLPGVSSVPRRPQDHVQIGKHTLVSSLPNPKLEVLHSKWNTRAWTFQEGLLSQRHLIFTEHQVYFQCADMYCTESIDAPLGALNKKFLQRQNPKFSFEIFPRQQVGNRQNNVFDRIREYVERDLTRADDILNSMLGIFGDFESKKVYHVWGLPIFSINVPKRRCASFLGEVWTFLAGLKWTASSSALLERRDGFPSWSWLGWQRQKGPRWDLEFTKPGSVQLSTYIEKSGTTSLINVNLELPNGQNVDISRADTLAYRTASQVLTIFAFVVSVKPSRDNNPHTLFTGPCLSNDQQYLKLEVKGYAAGLDSLLERTGLALVLPDALLVICEAKDADIYERIGIIDTKGSSVTSQEGVSLLIHHGWKIRLERRCIRLG